jgi:hypothetical protein
MRILDRATRDGELHGQLAGGTGGGGARRALSLLSTSLVSADVTRKCYHAAPCGICLKPDVSSGRVFDLTEGQIKARPVLIQRVRNLDQAGS